MRSEVCARTGAAPFLWKLVGAVRIELWSSRNYLSHNGLLIKSLTEVTPGNSDIILALLITGHSVTHWNSVAFAARQPTMAAREAIVGACLCTRFDLP
jgi:hypothetical protein